MAESTAVASALVAGSAPKGGGRPPLGRRRRIADCGHARVVTSSSAPVPPFFVAILGESVGAIRPQGLRRPPVVERERFDLDDGSTATACEPETPWND